MKSLARCSRRCALLLTALLAAAPLCADEDPVDQLYQRGKSTLHDLRWQVFSGRDLVADARSTDDPQQRDYLLTRAERALALARANVEKLKQLLEADKAKNGDLTSYTRQALQQQLTAYKQWLEETAGEVAALRAETPEEDAVTEEPSDADNDSDETASILPADELTPVEVTLHPQGNNEWDRATLLMRVDAVLHEIRLAQAHARANYYREGMGRKMKLAFNRHGGTGRHGWIWSWADSLWMHQYGYVSDARYADYRVAAERFRGELVHTKEITASHVAYTNRLVNLLPTWRADINRQYLLLDQIIDLYGQCGSAGEQGNQEWADRADKASKLLIEQLHQPSGVEIEPFAP